jgi:hypothetical protein
MFVLSVEPKRWIASAQCFNECTLGMLKSEHKFKRTNMFLYSWNSARHVCKSLKLRVSSVRSQNCARCVNSAIARVARITFLCTVLDWGSRPGGIWQPGSKPLIRPVSTARASDISFPLGCTSDATSLRKTRMEWLEGILLPLTFTSSIPTTFTKSSTIF